MNKVICFILSCLIFILSCREKVNKNNKSSYSKLLVNEKSDSLYLVAVHLIEEGDETDYKNGLKLPVDAVDEGARLHDMGYDAVGANATNATESWATIEADEALIAATGLIGRLGVGGVDPYNGQTITADEWTAANRAHDYFALSQWNKIEAVSDWMEENYSDISKEGSGFWNDSEKNQRYNYNLFRDKYMHKNSETGFWEQNEGMWKQNDEGTWVPKTPEELK